MSEQSDTEAKKIAEKQYAVKGNDLSGFRGVSPEYMTYANETDKPVAKKGSGKKQSGKQEGSPDEGRSAPSRPAAPKS